LGVNTTVVVRLAAAAFATVFTVAVTRGRWKTMSKADAA
jgi:hypothetical protein